MAIDHDLMGGTYKLLYLQLIAEGDICGVDIVRKISERTDGAVQAKAGSLYPQLQRLEHEGFVTSFFTRPDITRGRRTYCITEAGREELNRRMDEFDRYVDCVNMILCRKQQTV